MQWLDAQNVDGTTDWTDGNRSAGERGSPVNHDSFTQSMRELDNLIAWANATYPSAGIGAPTISDLEQVRKSIQAAVTPNAGDPPVAPNLPQLVTQADGTQQFTHGVESALTCAVLITNNLIDSTFDGTTFTVGPSDAGLYLIMGGTLFLADCEGLSHYIEDNGTRIAVDVRTAATASNLGSNVLTPQRLVAGDVVKTLVTASYFSGAGSSAPAQAVISRMSFTKLSV